MKYNLREMEVEELKKLYSVAEQALQKALLNGASWEEVKAKRDLVTDISIQLHKRKLSGGSSPAESNLR